MSSVFGPEMAKHVIAQRELAKTLPPEPMPGAERWAASDAALRPYRLSQLHYHETEVRRHQAEVERYRALLEVTSEKERLGG